MGSWNAGSNDQTLFLPIDILERVKNVVKSICPPYVSNGFSPQFQTSCDAFGGPCFWTLRRGGGGGQAQRTLLPAMDCKAWVHDCGRPTAVGSQPTPVGR